MARFGQKVTDAMKARIGLYLTATISVMPVEVGAQDPVTDADNNWAAIEQCAAIDVAEARHDCMDSVVRRAGLLSDERLADAARQEFGKGMKAVPQHDDISPAGPTNAISAPGAVVRSDRPSPPIRASEIEQLTTTVGSARTVGDRRLVVTTVEGSIWEQVQSETFWTLPKAGDRFTIERTSLGGFRCRFEKSSIFRCRRID